MKMFSALSVALVLIAAQAQAADMTYTYSNAEYCELAAQNTPAPLLKAYAKKLGFKPVTQACTQLLNPVTAQVEQDAAAQIRAYARGSARKLPASLVQQLKAMPAAERRAALMQIYG